MAVVPAPVDKAALARVAAANRVAGRETQRMGQLAKKLVTVEVAKPYPRIPIRERSVATRSIRRRSISSSIPRTISFDKVLPPDQPIAK